MSPEPAGESLSRAEQKQRTRQALAATTRELISERGYQATTIEDIAAAVGVSPRTFFRHFASKEAALFVRAEELAGRLEELLEGRPADEAPLASIKACMLLMGRTMQAEGRWMVEVATLAEEVPAIREQLDFRVGYLIRQTVQRWAERRLGVPSVLDPRPGLLAGIAAACADTSRQRWIAHAGQLELADLMAQSFDQLAELIEG